MKLHLIPGYSKNNAPLPEQFELFYRRHLLQTYKVVQRYTTTIDKKPYEVEVFEIPDDMIAKEEERLRHHMSVWKREGEKFTWVEKRKTAEQLAIEEAKRQKKEDEAKARKDAKKAAAAIKRKAASAAQKAAADEKKKKGGGEKKKKN